MIIQRSIEHIIKEYLQKKIVLLSGPRQVGKTFLSKGLYKKYQYLNFDLDEHRHIIINKLWLRDGSLVIFDEIHKYKNWKRWIKGIYDTEERGANQYLLTGSSRIDTFKKAGDSLAGRHLSVRLNPFSVREIGGDASKTIQQMLKYGPFPEPFLEGSEKKAALWRKSHLDVIIKQDLVQLESVKDLVSIELLISALRRRVGQQIVYKHLADELQVSPHTVKKWISVLESLFIIFTVYPYTKNVLDAVKKEPKIYFYDIAQVNAADGFRLENLVALHLLKRNQFLEDTEGQKMRLAYIRDKKHREVDFVIESENKIEQLIEVKSSDDSFNTHLNYFSKRFNCKRSYQLVLNLKHEQDHPTYKVRSLVNYLSELET